MLRLLFLRCFMTTIKYTQEAKCPKCKGILAYDATMRQKLPLGLGFAPNSTRFQVDMIERTGWRGECMNCQHQVFAVVREKKITRYPRSINSKIKAASAA